MKSIYQQTRAKKAELSKVLGTNGALLDIDVRKRAESHLPHSWEELKRSDLRVKGKKRGRVGVTTNAAVWPISGAEKVFLLQ